MQIIFEWASQNTAPIEPAPNILQSLCTWLVIHTAKG